MQQQELNRYRFGAFVFDTGTRSLNGPKGPIRLTPKEFQALVLLVQSEGRAIPREFMIAEIWPDSAVGDTSLGRIISVLRRHLGVEAIVSVSKFGYRFALDVQSEPSPDDELVAPRAQEYLVAPLIESASPNLLAGSFIKDIRHRSWLHVLLAGILVSAVAALLVIGLSRVYGASVSSEAKAAASRWDDMGVSAMRQGTYFKASKEFQQSVLIDPSSSLAHAHLADAWNELEMVDAAKNEILLANNHRHFEVLSGLDRHYVEAIRATVVRDYATATEEYQAILAALPEGEKSNGLEDLGRSYQREGRIADAIGAYKEATNREPSNASVQLHLGILTGLQRDQVGANSYLNRAAQLYEASTNLEGIAEIHYQRARMAYVRAAYSEAEREINTSLDIANRLADSQLQARAYGFLSTVERWDGKLDLSAQDAIRSFDLSARANWDYGLGEGVMLQANVAIAKHDLQQSHVLLERALDLAERVKSPRLIANAEFSTADLADQTGDYSKEIDYGHRAAKDYQSYGSVDGVSDARLLVIQGEAGNGDLQQALQDAEDLLARSEQTHSDVFAEDSEAEIGRIYTMTGDYPLALQHYQRALDWSKKTDSQIALKSLHVAECLAHIGRLKEAHSLFQQIPSSAKTDPDSALSYNRTSIALEYAEGHYKKVILEAREMSTKSLAPDVAISFLKLQVMAELLASQKQSTITDSESLMVRAQNLGNSYWIANASLVRAIVELTYGSPQNADRMATLAARYFTAQHLRQSSWLAQVTDAEALHRLGRALESERAMTSAFNSLEELGKEWPKEDFQAFLRRDVLKGSIETMAVLERSRSK